MLDPTGHAFALAMAVLIAAIYIALIRFLDLNEKEPLWSIGLLFILGAVASLVLRLVVPSTVLEMGPIWPAILEPLALFLAIAAGMWALFAIGALRGWSEVSGMMDGVVYGATAGLGFATGVAFIRLGASGGVAALPGITAWDILWTTALVGLIDGVLGGIVGAGFGASTEDAEGRKRVGLPIGALVLAILVDLAYRWLKYGDALGQSASLRLWLALGIPVVMIGLLWVIALLGERRTIATQLADETDDGTVTPGEYATLKSTLARQALYLRTLVGGRLHRCAALKSLHGRQVQLALAKARLSRADDPLRRVNIEREILALRGGIEETRRALDEANRTEGVVS